MAREKNIPKKTPTLTDKQQGLAIKLFTRDKITDILDITRLIFENDELDYRSPETRAVKKYLADNGHDGAPKVETKEEKPKEIFELGFEHREFIEGNFPGMTTQQIFRTLFPGNQNYMSAQHRAIQSFAKELNPDAMKGQETLDKEYKGPSTLQQTVRLVNDVAFANISTENPNPQQLAGLKALMKHIRAPSFVQAINSYVNKSERELFEAEYVRITHDKPDLTAEELILCITLCKEIISAQRAEKMLSKLEDQLSSCADEERAKISMSLSETIKNYKADKNLSVDRIRKLTDDLVGKRSKRNADRKASNRSIAVLVEKVMAEEDRQNLVKISKLRKETIDKEVEKFSQMDDLIAKIFGIGPDDIIQ